MKINILPPQEKKLLQLAMTCRKLIALLALTVLACFIFIGLSWAVDFYLQQQINQTKWLVAQKESYIESIGFQQFKQLLTETNEKIIRLQSFKQKTVAITSLFGRLAEQVPPDIFFTNFSFQTSFPQSDINAAGFAQDRDSLFQFKQDLEEVDGLNNVYFQPSSWVKPEEANFVFKAQYQAAP